jgi:hypothetical protein
MSGKYPGGFVTAGAPAGYSVYFDDASSELTIANNANLIPTTQNFWIEAFIYITVPSATNSVFSKYTSASVNFTLYVTSSNFLAFDYNGSTSTSSGALSANTWYHVAVVRSGTSTNQSALYVNGTRVLQFTMASDFSSVTSTARIGRYQTGGAYFGGYISNLRYGIGTTAPYNAITDATINVPTQLFPVANTQLLTCQSTTIIDNSINAFTIATAGTPATSTFTPFAGYTAGASGFQPALGAAAPGVWTLDEATTYQGNRQWPIYDPNFKQTTLMLHGNNPTNLPAWIKDASTNNFAVTVNGDAKASNQTPFNTSWSNQVGSFNSVSNYIATSSTTLMNFGTAAYTIEFWIYLPSYGGGTGYVYGNNQTSGAPQTYVNSNGQLVFQYVGTSAFATTTTAIALNTWTHVAIVRTSTSASGFAVYFNGVNGLTSTDSRNVTATTALWIGNSGTSPMAAGLISNFRVCKGTAVYTANFTPSSIPLTTTSQGATNCVLLTCQNGYFVDNAATPSTLTLTNSPSIQYNNPFGSSLLTGGAGYFDGTVDQLSLANNAAFDFGTGNFTLECWVYITGTIGSIINYSNGQTSNSNFAWEIYQSSSTGIQLSILSGATAYIASSTAFSLNAWNHVAGVRNGNTLTIYVNGIAGGTTASVTGVTISSPANSTVKISGYNNATGMITGYVSNVRIVKGTAVYTANFTPSTTPLTAIGGTSLLTLQNTQPTNNSAFVDSSVSNLQITRAGNATQGAFTPFSQTGWSLYLDGPSGQGISYPTTANTQVGCPAGTRLSYEFWYYCTGVQGITAYNMGILGATPAVAVNGRWSVTLGGSTTQAVTYYWTTGTGTSDQVTNTTQLSQNQWYHVAICIDATTAASSTITIYINGVGQTFTGKNLSTQTVANEPGYQQYIGQDRANQSFWGYISNLRIVRGSLPYSANFTPPTAPLTAIPGTVMLACQNNRFLDNSSYNWALGITGTVGSSQTYSPFVPTVTTPVTYSNYFDGSTGYLTIASNSAFSFGTGSFTWETWFYSTGAISGNDCFYDLGSANTTGGFAVFTTGSTLYVRINGTGQDLTYSLPTNWTNTWHHLAVVRSGTTLTIYLDGVSVASGTRAQDVTQSSPYIGNGAGVLAAYYFSGCLSNMRVVKGVAVYTAAFTPPTAPLTNITNTSLLTCQSSTFVDNSSNNFTITATGTVQPVASPTPFAPLVDQTTLNTAYSTARVGGSGYFDRTTDYLDVISNASLTIGTNNFTIAFWAYFNVIDGTTQIIFEGRPSTVADNVTPTILYSSVSNSWSYRVNGVGVITGTASVTTAGQWYYVVVSRLSGTTRLFVNGAQQGSDYADSNNYVSFASDRPRIAERGNNNGTGTAFGGYLSGLQLLVGTALYIKPFAPPLTPPTPVTNTQLLLGYTNAGIIDNTGDNNLETLSSAQISTVQSKYGGSSIQFNGTTDYLVARNSPNWDMGGGSYTVELWIYMNTLSGNQTFVARANTGSIYATFDIGWYSSALRLYVSNNGSSNAVALASSISPVAATWTHIAVTRNGSTYTIWVNGVSGGTATDTGSAVANGNNLGIGAYGNGVNPLNGYMDDLRITKGVARYTTTFTPPTSQLQDQ